MELFISIKEASELVGKVEMTIRRAVKKAPSNMTATDDKGRLLIDKSYIMSLYNITESIHNVTANVSDNLPIQTTNNDVAMLALTKELENKQDTLNSLSDRLQEANTIINTLTNKLTETTSLLLEAKESVYEEAPIEKKSFPLLEVISIGVSIVFAGAIVFYVLSIR
jgi:septal ring factor EnvC (AmiA/AmiB activator)